MAPREPQHWARGEPALQAMEEVQEPMRLMWPAQEVPLDQ